MSKWKYFTDEESMGQTDDLCFKRDLMRQFYGGPLIQTCGLRTEDQAIADGCPDSAHVTGQATDIAAPQDPALRAKLMWAAGLAQFERAEYAPNHFHFDVDKTKPSPCFFSGLDH